MSLPVPGWWAVILLSLAAFRVYRLIARDTITEPARAAVTYPDDEAITLGETPSEAQAVRDECIDRIAAGLDIPRELLDIPERRRLRVIGDDEQPKGWRIYLSTLIRCPWCLGFYVSVAWWACWTQWPTPTLFAAAPLTVSAVVAMLAKMDT